MKKLIAGLLASFTLCSAPVLAAEQQAAVNQTDVTVSLTGIEQIMLQYSPDMQKVKNDLDTAKGSYYDLLSDMKDLQDEISESDVSIGVALTKQFEEMEDPRDKLKCAYDVAQAQYNQKVARQVLKAQQQFITYFVDAAQEATSTAQLARQNKDLTLAAQRLSKGYLSQTSYDNMVTAVSELQDSISAIRTQREAALRDLRILLGIPSSVTMKLETPSMTEVDFDKLLSMDFEKDLAELLTNSAEVKAKQISYDSQYKGDYAKSWEIEAAKIALQQTRDSVAESFRKQYDGLQNSYKALKTSRVKLENKKRDMANAQTKIQKGYLSDNTFANMKLELQTLESSVITQENKLYCAYLVYLQTKMGN